MFSKLLNMQKMLYDVCAGAWRKIGCKPQTWWNSLRLLWRNIGQQLQLLNLNFKPCGQISSGLPPAPYLGLWSLYSRMINLWLPKRIQLKKNWSLPNPAISPWDMHTSKTLDLDRLLANQPMGIYDPSPCHYWAASHKSDTDSLTWQASILCRMEEHPTGQVNH